jgi:hypothetical protein
MTPHPDSPTEQAGKVGARLTLKPANFKLPVLDLNKRER